MQTPVLHVGCIKLQH